MLTQQRRNIFPSKEVSLQVFIAMKAFIEQKPGVSQWASVTEDPRYNEPLYNEFLGIKNTVKPLLSGPPIKRTLSI